MRHKHQWTDIGQTYTKDTRTVIYWCELCGILKYKRVAGDYKTWVKRLSKIKKG